MTTVKIQYGPYVEEECCEDCSYAGDYNLMGDGRPVQICPTCGGQLVTTIGRWMYTEAPYPWMDFLMIGCRQTTYHGFLKGRNTDIDPDGTVRWKPHPSRTPPPPHPDNNYTLEGSLAAYKAGHK